MSDKNYIRALNERAKWKDYLEFELVLFCLYETKMRVSLNKGYTMFLQYYRDAVKSLYNEKHEELIFLRKHCHKYSNAKIFKTDLSKYNGVSDDTRLFMLDDYLKINPSFCDSEINRRITLLKYLKTEMSFNCIKVKDVCSSEGYFIISQYEGNQKYKSKINFSVNDDMNSQVTKLPKYLNKTRVEFKTDFDYIKMLNISSSDLIKRPSFKLEKIGQDTSKLYNKSNHIVGLLGAGKSTYITLETIRLVKENKVRVGIVVPQVKDVVSLFKLLVNEGISVTPIIGRSSVREHFERYLETINGNMSLITDLLQDNHMIVEYLSGTCLMEGLTNHSFMSISDYPCEKILQPNSNKEYLCSLASKCGHMRQSRDLAHSSVWITTPHALLKSSPGSIFDDFGRSYYELFYDSLDVVFIDEVDSCQTIFDESFIFTRNINSGNNSMLMELEKIYRDVNELVVDKIDDVINSWKMTYLMFQNGVNMLEYLVQKKVAIGKYVSSSTITVNETAEYILNELEEDVPSSDNEMFNEIIKDLASAAYSETFDKDNPLYKLYYDVLLHRENYSFEESLDFIESNISQIFPKIKLKKKLKIGSMSNLYQLVYLLILIVYTSVQIRKIREQLRIISANYPEIKTLGVIENSLVRKFQPYAHESIIGRISGFNFSLDNGKTVMSFIEYSMIGRGLVENWAELKDEDGLEGPSIIALSGTSFAPESSHYHFRDTPRFLLKSGLAEGEINQFILLKEDINFKKISHKDERFLKVSGVPTYLKQDSLKRLIASLQYDIHYEIRYWSECNRKVLLIVNSYEQCAIVAKKLSNLGFKCRFVSKEQINENSITASQLEQLHEMIDFQVLVAPLVIISRGYNILNSRKDSLFGTAFFLIRPYISPDDIQYEFQVYNEYTIKTFNELISAHTEPLDDLFDKHRGRVWSFYKKSGVKQSMGRLTNEERMILGWYTLISVKQAIGRMQRNGNSCRVFYCDASFAGKFSAGLSSDSSLLKTWEELLCRDKSEVSEALYSSFSRGLTRAINTFNEAFCKEEEFNE